MKEIVNIDGEYYIHFSSESDHRICFEVYPICEWINSSGKRGVSYYSKENDPDTIDVFEEGKCLIKMEGSYMWRGVWEGRLYFPDVEYWGSDLKELSDLYDDHIIPFCEQKIRERCKYAE